MLAHDSTRWWLAASEIVSTKNKANNAEQMRASKQSADGARTITGHGDVTMMDCRVNVTFDNFKYLQKHLQDQDGALRVEHHNIGSRSQQSLHSQPVGRYVPNKVQERKSRVM